MIVQDIDLSIFQSLFEKRPEINKDFLKKDLENYYLPFINKLITLKNASVGNALVVGISAIQGTGKTTQGEILEILLKSQNHSSVSLSIDDHYLTHQELTKLRSSNPRYIRRGVTHDIPLAIMTLKSLSQMSPNTPVLVSGYDKGAHQGDGDRFRFVNLIEGLVIKARVNLKTQIINKVEQTTKVLEILSATYHNTPLSVDSLKGADIPLLEHFLPNDLIYFLGDLPNQVVQISQVDEQTVRFVGATQIEVSKKDLPHAWRLVTKKPDFIFYDGWMLGARKVEDTSVFESGLPALETPEDQEFAKMINQKLVEYEPLWQLIDYLNCLYVPNYQLSLQWRDQAEEPLRQKGEGMTSEQIRQFVYYFWRSVHPAIHIKRVAQDPLHTSQVVIINDDHTIKEVLTAQQVITKYS